MNAPLPFDDVLADARIAEILTAIEGQSPDPSEDQEFQSLEAEFRKMESSGPGSVNWVAFNAGAIAVLAKQSKHLPLACRLVFGLFRAERYKGLAVGLTSLDLLIQACWDNLYPPTNRMLRPRVNSLTWLAQRLSAQCEAMPPEAAEFRYAAAAYERLCTLDTFLRSVLDGREPGMFPLIRVLRGHAQQFQPEPDSQAQTVDAAETAPKAATPAPVTRPAAVPVDVPKIEISDDVETGFNMLFEAASRLAGRSRATMSRDARPYLAARFALWGQIGRPPPDKGGLTGLSAPTKQRRKEIDALRQSAQAEGLLMAAEGAFVSTPFWLDAQRLVCEAMAMLGPECEAARRAVRAESHAFVERLPQLVGLSFGDGTPFADNATREWLAAGTAPAKGDADVPAAAELTDAETRAAGGDLAGALDLLSAYMSGCSGRARFQAQLATLDFCLRHAAVGPAFHLMSVIEAAAAAHDLGAWEPALLRDYSALAWRILSHRDVLKFVDEKSVSARKSALLQLVTPCDLGLAARLMRS